MRIYCPTFVPGNPIPSKYSCEGENISFPLTWKEIPDGAESLAIIMDDPDAPAVTWVHWLIYNIPVNIAGLPENIKPEKSPPDSSLQGRNSWNKIGYGGPCPPFGTHRYYVKLYALDCLLEQEAGLSKKSLLKAMQGHVLEEAQMFGTYKKSR